MRRIWIGLGVLAMVLAGAGAASAQELWRGARLGMSPAEVRGLFADAAPPPAVITLMGGETDDLVLKGVRLGGVNMTARFFFRDGLLTTVQLAPARRLLTRPEDNMRLAQDLRAELGQEFGAPFECGDKSYAGVAMFNCKWLKGPIVVRLWYMDVMGQSPNLRIGFRKADDPSYDY
jgi:hypothetical protein